MPKTDLEIWLQGREPAPPPVFLPRLLEAGGERADPVAMGGAAVEALAAALERPGRDREAAFLLLTADALLTYASEAFASGPDPGKALGWMLDQIGNRFGS